MVPDARRNRPSGLSGRRSPSGASLPDVLHRPPSAGATEALKMKRWGKEGAPGPLLPRSAPPIPPMMGLRAVRARGARWRAARRAPSPRRPTRRSRCFASANSQPSVTERPERERALVGVVSNSRTHALSRRHRTPLRASHPGERSRLTLGSTSFVEPFGLPRGFLVSAVAPVVASDLRGIARFTTRTVFRGRPRGRFSV